MNTLGLIYALIALLGFGLSNAISKQPVASIGPLRLVFLRACFTSTILFVVLLLSANQASFSLTWIGLTVLVSIIGFVPLFTFYKAAEVGKMGVVAPVAYTSTIVTILLALIFYDEPLTASRLVAFILTVFGVTLLTINFKDFANSDITKLSSGVPYAVISSLGSGLFFFLSKIFVSHLGVILASFLVEIENLALAFIFLKAKKEPVYNADKNTLKMVGMIGILGSIAIVAYYQAIKLLGISTTATIYSAAPMVVVLYGLVFYKERLRLQQYGAIAAILLGLIIIAQS